MTLPFPIQFASNGPQWAQGFDAWYDYTKPQGSQLLAFPPATDTHSATIYAQSSSGVWQAIPANVASQTDLGLQTVPTRTEKIPRSIFAGTPGASTVPTGWAQEGSTIAVSTLLATETVTGIDTEVVRLRRINPTGNEGIRYAAVGVTLAQHVVSVSVRVPTGVTATDLGAYFGVSTPSAVTIASAATLNAQPKDVWVRYSATVTFSANTSDLIALVLGAGAAGTGVDIALPNFQVGAFAVPFIATTGTSATVNGNQQVVDLTGRLESGVGGIVQFVLPAGGTTSGRVLSLDDGTTGNRVNIIASATVISIQVSVGGVDQGSVIGLGAAPVAGTVYTLAFAAATSYFNIQVVGQAAGSAVTSGTYPSISKFQVAALGGVSGTAYQLTKRTALQFGDQNAGTFAALASKATLLAAVS